MNLYRLGLRVSFSSEKGFTDKILYSNFLNIIFVEIHFLYDHDAQNPSSFGNLYDLCSGLKEWLVRSNNLSLKDYSYLKRQRDDHSEATKSSLRSLLQHT